MVQICSLVFAGPIWATSLNFCPFYNHLPFGHRETDMGINPGEGEMDTRVIEN